MSDQKIKNREALLSHGDAGAKAQVLELTERVLHRLDARKRLHDAPGGQRAGHRQPPPRSEPVPSCVRFFLRQGGQSHGTGLRGSAGGVSDAGRHHHQDPG